MGGVIVTIEVIGRVVTIEVIGRVVVTIEVIGRVVVTIEVIGGVIVTVVLVGRRSGDDQSCVVGTNDVDAFNWLLPPAKFNHYRLSGGVTVWAVVLCVDVRCFTTVLLSSSQQFLHFNQTCLALFSV